MQVMKITISVDDKELLSFDIVILIGVLTVYLIYKLISFTREAKSEAPNTSSNEDVKEEKISETKRPQHEEKRPERKEDSVVEESKSTSKPYKFYSEEVIKKEEPKPEQKAKQDDDWTVVKNGKKVTSKQKKN